MTLNRRLAGYSLLEILVVLVLMGVLGSLAGPSMGAYLRTHKTRRALDQIASDLALARMTAVRSGRPAVVRFVGANTYQIEQVGSAAVRNVPLGRDYAGVVVAPPAAPLQFNSRGILVSDLSPGYIVVTLGAARDSLLITPAGRVYRGY